MNKKLPGSKLPKLGIVFILFFNFLLGAQNFERVETIVGLDGLANNNGVAIADFDGDNDLDIFVVANAVENSEDVTSYSRLYKNNNDGSFTDVTETSGLVDLLTAEENVQASLVQNGYKYSASWGGL